MGQETVHSKREARLDSVTAVGVVKNDVKLNALFQMFALQCILCTSVFIILNVITYIYRLAMITLCNYQ